MEEEQKEEKKEPESNAVLVWACVLSLVLLVFFGWLQASKSSMLDLKPQWLWIAVLPILLALVTGKYIGKLKAAGIEYQQYEPPKLDPQMRLLLYAPPPEPGVPSDKPRATEKEQSVEPQHEWTAKRTQEYDRTNRLFLVHVYEPSTRPNQKYDVTIFLMRHVPGGQPNQRDKFLEVEKLELYLGPAWNDRIFTALNEGGIIGVRTSAWGSFLAVGRVTFNDNRSPIVLQRYVDFEMAPKKT
jgi:hypothetical protein